MAKRFIDTDLFKKSFFRGLSAPHKLLWLYILTDCNHAGIWETDFEVAKLRCGFGDFDGFKKAFEEKIIEFDNGTKWFIPSFISFQYGELNEKNNAHLGVLRLLKQYDLEGHLRGSLGAQDMDMVQEKDKEQEKDKVMVQEKEIPGAEKFLKMRKRT